jgi:hypothetical protein
MSVLFISEPQPFMPVYNPLNFVFYSIDHGTEPDFKYIVDVEVNGVFVSQHEVYNTNVGQARFDCSEVVKARLTSSILALSEITTDYFNSICQYQITVTEYYTGATHDSETSTELRAFNGSLRTDVWLNWDWNDYTLNSDGTNFKKFLTDFPRNEKQFVRSTDSCYIGMMTNGNMTSINVELFDVSGATITTTTLPIVFGSNLFVINPNVALIEELTGVSFDSCYYYEVEVAGLLSTTEKFRFYIDRECERYPSVRLVWLNKYGVWDAYTFKLDSISESDIQTIMHESTLGQWSDSGYNYAIANGQHLTHLKEVTDRLILNSDWIKPAVQNWLVRSLYESPLVYIESVDFTQQESETCDTILVTYTLVGEEPVTVEVEKVGDEYTTDEFKILKDGTDWIVQAIEETPVSGCDCIKVNYSGGTISPIILDVFNGKNRYQFTHLGNTYYIYWDTFSNSWRLLRVTPSIVDFGNLVGSTDTCPFGTYSLTSGSGGGVDTFGTFEVVQCTEFIIYATLSEDTECPFGTYTIEEGSIFEAFEVEPVSLTVPAWSYEPLNVMNELSRQKTSKRDMLIQEQVTAKRTFDYKSQIL